MECRCCGEYNRDDADYERSDNCGCWADTCSGGGSTCVKHCPCKSCRDEVAIEATVGMDEF